MSGSNLGRQDVYNVNLMLAPDQDELQDLLSGLSEEQRDVIYMWQDDDGYITISIDLDNHAANVVMPS